MEYNFKDQTSLLIQKNDDGSYLMAIGERTFEGQHIAINFVSDDRYFAGLDDPACFELYEDVLFDCDVSVENDESISIDLRLA